MREMNMVSANITPKNYSNSTYRICFHYSAEYGRNCDIQYLEKSYISNDTPRWQFVQIS